MKFVDQRKRIPYGTRLPVSLTRRQVALIKEYTFADASLLAIGEAKGSRVQYRFSLDTIEEIQGYVAAEANHTEDTTLQAELERLFDYFQRFLDSFDDQGEL